MARVSKKAEIGAGVEIAETAIVHDSARIGDGCSIGEYCIIGHPARGEWAGKPLLLGAGSLVRSHTIIYEGSTFGERTMIGHSSLVREGVTAGVNLQIGSFNDIEGDCVLGDWVRFHSNVHICRGTTIGDLTWIFPYVVTTNDPSPPSGLKVGARIGAGAVVCTGSIVLPGTVMEDGAFAGAYTRVSGHVPSAAVVIGNPAQVIGSLRRIRYKPEGKQHPWMHHHADAYPEDAQARIAELKSALDSACDGLDADPAYARKG